MYIAQVAKILMWKQRNESFEQCCVISRPMFPACKFVILHRGYVALQRIPSTR